MILCHADEAMQGKWDDRCAMDGIAGLKKEILHDARRFRLLGKAISFWFDGLVRLERKEPSRRYSLPDDTDQLREGIERGKEGWVCFVAVAENEHAQPWCRRPRRPLLF
jgi:hypothetical protein